MTNEEFQKLVLSELKEIKSNMATKADVAKLEKGIGDIIAMSDVTQATVNKIHATQITQGESINILALRQLQTESELAAIKKAK